MPATIRNVMAVSFDLCVVLAEVEANGMKIDVEALEKIDKDLEQEEKDLLEVIDRTITEFSGDDKININSNDDLSRFIYSRSPKDKKQWASVFEIGTDDRNSVKKAKKPKRYPKGQFSTLVRALTDVYLKQRASRCSNCNGYGKISRRKKGGGHTKPNYICPECSGKGFNLRPIARNGSWVTAGLGLPILNVQSVAAHGFPTDKGTLSELKSYATTKEQRDFLTAMERIGSVRIYRSNFVNGIRRNVQKHTGILHPKFNQTVAATGRLSSSDPNLHNQPRGATLPVRRCIVSRWRGGKILEVDFSTLEFRVAVELSGDKVGLEELSSGDLDAHTRTAQILKDHGQKTSRQDAKADTFKPLYGGSSGTPAQKAYYAFFAEHYAGIASWHNELCREAVQCKRIKIPSGREYSFPDARELYDGYVLGSTQIKNWPVQGFATGDLVPAVAIEVWRYLRDKRSLLINEVHDNVVIDLHPEDIAVVPPAVVEIMSNAHVILEQRYGYDSTVRYPVEAKIGDNWLDMETLHD